MLVDSRVESAFWAGETAHTFAQRALAGQFLLDLAKTVLAEEHLALDEEGRDPEDPACDGGLGIGDQLRLDLRIAGGRDQASAVEACGVEHPFDHGWIIHLLAGLPHG